MFISIFNYILLLQRGSGREPPNPPSKSTPVVSLSFQNCVPEAWASFVQGRFSKAPEPFRARKTILVDCKQRGEYSWNFLYEGNLCSY